MKLSTQFIILFNATLSVLLIIGQIAPCLSMCLEPPVPLAGSQLSPWLSPCASCWLLPVATAKLSKPSQAGHGTGQQHMEIIRHLGFVLFGWVLRWLWVMQWTVPCSTLAAPNQTEASGRHFCHSFMRWREIFHALALFYGSGVTAHIPVIAEKFSPLSKLPSLILLCHNLG